MHKLTEGSLHVGRHGGAGDVAEDRVKMVQGERDEMPGVLTHEDLVLDGHGHQVVELVHAVAVELHDGGVSQLIKHRLEHPPAVYRLVLDKDLLDEPSVEHCGHDIVHNLTADHILVPLKHYMTTGPYLTSPSPRPEP